MKVRAMFYEKIKDKVHCLLCPHHCVIENGHLGKCRVRKHEDGELFTLNYGELTSLALDPIEKKPLTFFKPRTFILSAGSFGCNFTCSFCQNYSISQYDPESPVKARSQFVSKEELVQIALTTEDNIGIAFTYNEPTIWYEYVYDCARLLKEKDPKASVVLVTNGYINQEPLKQLLPFTDAMNIDLKSFKNETYRKLCGGRLKPVLQTIETAVKSCHVEITTLLITNENDSLEEVEEIAKFLSELDSNIPLHLSRYFPRYQMAHPPTDIGFMRRAAETAGKYLNRVVLGNVW